MCFACLSTMGAPLTFDDFGPANFMLFIPLIYIVAGVGGVAGPITAINIAYYKYALAAWNNASTPRLQRGSSVEDRV